MSDGVVPGATRRADGTTRFVVAAAGPARVEVLVKAGDAGNGDDRDGGDEGDEGDGKIHGAPAGDRILTLAPADRDRTLPLCWHRWEGAGDFTGRRYRIRVDDGPWLPDPASRWNPDDVHGDSVVVDDGGFAWQHDDWAGLPWHRFVIHEIHIGCFTEAGTFAAAAERLPALAALGITAIEVMPVADFAGRRNWGYDGVLPYAPDAGYGRPDDFRRFVDAAHGLGMAVILDVVYNHFGPEGNYLHGLAPAFFDCERQTLWGGALNVDGPGSAAVRAFFVENAWYWIDAFRLDGLRLDAVHAIADDSPSHLVVELARTVAARLEAAGPAGSESAGSAGPGRRAVHLIVENERNQAGWLERDAAGRPRVATAQWNDDIHHALHVLLTGETDGYYIDFAQAPARLLADGLARGFIYRGQQSRHAGAARGEPSAGLPPTALINFLQNHDQIGNRAFGERITALAPARAVAVASACVLLGPAIPMLFMGEEFAASTPFLYFCDYDGDLAEAVRRGRRREFARFARFADPQTRERIPDPNDEATFARSRLVWPNDGDGNSNACASPPGPTPVPGPTSALAVHRRGLAARRRWVEPLLAAGDVPVADDTMLGERAFVVHWRFAGGSLALAASFGETGGAPLPAVDGCRPVWRLDPDGPLESALAAWDFVLFRDPGATPGP